MSAARRQEDAGGEIFAGLSRLAQAPLLDAGEELRLAAAARAGCPESRRKLIEANMRLVISIARNYARSPGQLEDLVQEGAIGLMRSVDRYDPSLGFRFSTYATHWIRQAIGRAAESPGRTIRLPAHVNQLLRKVGRARLELMQALATEPSAEAIAAHAGLSVEKVRHLIAVSQDALSLDSPDTSPYLVRDPDARHDPEAESLSDCLVEELREAMGCLSPRERHVIEWRLRRSAGMEEEEDPMESLAISRERVRQIEQTALKKLRRLAQRRLLGAFLGP